MPFQLTTVEDSFRNTEYDYFFTHHKPKENTNYSIVLDYLTGKTTSLQGLDSTQNNIVFFPLLELIKSPGSPTANDNLVFDVLFHPDIFYAVQYYLYQWMSACLLQYDDDKSTPAILALFQRAGLRANQVFELLIHYLQNQPAAYEILAKPDSLLKRFLLQNVPTTTAQRQHNVGPFYFNNNWNYLYFLLMEEAQPQLALDYLFNGLLSSQENVVTNLLQHREGKYVPAVEQWIEQPPRTTTELTAKLRSAVLLHELNKEKYSELIVQASKIYLQNYPVYFGKSRWETSMYLPNSSGREMSHLACSAVAIYYLLPQEKELVKEQLLSWLKKKFYVSVDVFSVLQFKLKEESLPYLQQGLQSTTAAGGNDYYRRMIQLLTENFSAENYLPVLWGLVTAKSRVVREMIVQIVVEKDKEAEKKAIELLKHKNAEARQTGAMILSAYNSPEAIAAVNELLDKETNDNARDIFLQIIKDSLPKNADDAFRQQLIHSADQRNKLTKSLEPWLDESSLPPLHYQLGESIPVKEVRFLFYRMSRVKGMRSDVEANYLLQHINKEKAGDFAKAILDNFISSGAKPEHKYILALAALIGNEDVVDRLRTLTNRWVEEGRLKMAEYGVGALALQGSNKALRWVEWYSRKYKTKKANVGAAALQALQDAAEELGITIHELGDRVVPDFGFEGLFKTFTINGDEYRAFIDSRFKLCYFNEENKQLKALPAVANAELKEEFKQIGKEVRDVVRSQSGRMEYYLLIQRQWTSDAWTNFFLANPVMFIYATKLLWGIYSEEGRLLNCFVCLEDTTLVDSNDDEIAVDENCLIGLVHPLELSAEQLDLWKRKFFDLSIEPVFPQLERPVYKLGPEDANRKIVHDFAGKETQPNSIKPTLERFGWRAGDPADAGSIDSFHLDDSLHGIMALLEVEGVFVSFGWENESKMGKLYFLDKQKQQTRWVQSPADEKDERLIALKDLPPVLYSEVMYNLTCIKLKTTDGPVV